MTNSIASLQKKLYEVNKEYDALNNIMADLETKRERILESLGKKKAMDCPAYRIKSIRRSKCLLQDFPETKRYLFLYSCSGCNKRNIVAKVLKRKLGGDESET